MTHKSLIVYASWTGNTEKVAFRFKQVFDKNDWNCDIFKVDRKTDFKNLPFDFNNYELVCIGSPVIGKRPTDDISMVLGGPKSLKGSPSSDENLAYAKGELGPCGDDDKVYQKIVFTRKGIIFLTAGECHIPLQKGADPAFTTMECDMEHRKIEVIGKFVCPGKAGISQSPYFKDLPLRPHERDLMKAQIFLEELLEEYF